MDKSISIHKYKMSAFLPTVPFLNITYTCSILRSEKIVLLSSWASYIAQRPELAVSPVVKKLRPSEVKRGVSGRARLECLYRVFF
jgi:hypothetical protein